MRINLLKMSLNRVEHLKRRLTYNLNEKETKATWKMLLKEMKYGKYLLNKDCKELGYKYV
jgi:hypothetical protein